MKDVLARLKRLATRKTLESMARYAIPADRAFGVAMRDVQKLAKELGRDHALATQLWETGYYEARLLACYVGEPERLSSAQMDAWCRDFDNWAVCDTACFVLFDKSPKAWGRIGPWSRLKAEFPRRGAFALIWGLALHDKSAPEARFREALRRIEGAADDPRPYVRKAIAMALRAIARRHPSLRIPFKP